VLLAHAIQMRCLLYLRSFTVVAQPFAYLPVALIDDRAHTYRRPHVGEVISAWLELDRRDNYEGGLPEDLVEPIRILLGVITRLPVDGVVQAFPPPPAPPSPRAHLAPCRSTGELRRRLSRVVEDGPA
jgi:hypothetical protein